MIDTIKNQVITHCNKYDKLVEESILKIKFKKSDFTEDQIKQGVQLALDALGSNLVFNIQGGRSGYYKVIDTFDRNWIIANSLEELKNYSYGEITIRGLHYRMVARGMTNSNTHYSRVKSAMVFARRNSLIEYEQFSDHDREAIGQTSSDKTDVDSQVSSSKFTIEYWLENYYKNKWENQYYYPEIWIEKKALIGVFENICNRNDVLLAPCKGYPSLTFLKDAANRFEAFDKTKKLIILYFGDYDASGEDIPRSIKDNLLSDFGIKVEVRRVLLLKDQVIEMNLPPAPTKSGDSRGNNWTGLGQVELDAVEPRIIQQFCQGAIDNIFDKELYQELQDLEKTEKKEYQAQLKDFVLNYSFDE